MLVCPSILKRIKGRARSKPTSVDTLYPGQYSWRRLSPSSDDTGELLTIRGEETLILNTMFGHFVVRSRFLWGGVRRAFYWSKDEKRIDVERQFSVNCISSRFRQNSASRNPLGGMLLTFLIGPTRHTAQGPALKTPRLCVCCQARQRTTLAAPYTLLGRFSST